MYLNTQLNPFEYIHMKLTNFPKNIIDEFKLSDIVNSNGCFYMEIHKALYGLSRPKAIRILQGT